GPREDKMECAAFSEFAFDPDIPAVQQHELATNIKPEPYPLFGRGISGFNLVQALEDMVLLVFRNATTGVGDGDLNQLVAIPSLSCFQHDAPAAGGVFDG